ALPGEAPADLVQRLAALKASAVGSARGGSSVESRGGSSVESRGGSSVESRGDGARGGSVGDVLVLAADTVVALDGALLGKPQGRDDYCRMLAALSGKTHEVYTGFALVPAGAATRVGVVATKVTFRRLTNDEIDAYWETGEPQDKAGGYGIQGHGRGLVAAFDGSHTNVMGLPMEAVSAELSLLGVEGDIEAGIERCADEVD
ncbi:MAG: Maf family protein, partial [Pseudomonadales bacterium]